MENEVDQIPRSEFILKQKISDMLKYGNPVVMQFGKPYRALAVELKTTMLNMYKLAVAVERKYYKKTTLQELDTELDWLRHLIRMAKDKTYFGPKYPPPLAFSKYEYWARLLDEIGRILGGYMKYVQK